MSKLLEEAANPINTIKSTNAFTASDVLRNEKKKAEEKTKNSKNNTVYLPKINTRSDTQEEANRLNQYYQVAIRVKEGTTEAWLEIVGKYVLDPVLRDADGIAVPRASRTTGSTTISRANRPKERDTLKQLVAVLISPYNFRKKVATNFEMRKQVNKLNTNKPTGYSPHSKNEFQALSTSIDYHLDLGCKFWQNSGRNFDSLPDLSFLEPECYD
jgi:hypothetical protein